MTGFVQVAYADSFSECKGWSAACITIDRCTLAEYFCHILAGQYPLDWTGRHLRLARAQLFWRNQLVFQEQLHKSLQPDAVVANSQILGRRHRLPGSARFIQIPCAGCAHCQRDGKNIPFPVMVEQMLIVQGMSVGFGSKTTKTLQAPHIVDAVHADKPDTGKASPVPIIELRVTSMASSCSLRCWL